MNKSIAIVNPKSGNFLRRSHNQRMLDLLQRKQSLTIFKTEKPYDASHIALKAFNEGCRDFFIFGGDGTIFETINGLYPHAKNNIIRLGIFASGTGNSMIRDFEPDPNLVFQAIENQQTRPCTVLQMVCMDKTYYFTNLASIGFVTQIAKCRNQYFSKLGPMGYVMAVLTQMPFYKPQNFNFSIDGQPQGKSWMFLSFNNTRYTGGNMMMAPHACAHDKRIAYTLVEPLSKWKLIQAFPRIFNGTHADLREVTLGYASNVTFHENEKQDVMVDGEILTCNLKSLSVLPCSLEIFG